MSKKDIQEWAIKIDFQAFPITSLKQILNYETTESSWKKNVAGTHCFPSFILLSVSDENDTTRI